MSDTIIFTFEMVEKSRVLCSNRCPAMTLPITVTNYGPDRESRRRAEREATLHESIRRAMGSGYTVSRVVRPNCECDCPRQGASGCCANCGGENFSANPAGHITPEAPDCLPETGDAQAYSQHEANRIAHEQICWGLERLGMQHVTLDVQWNRRFSRRLGDARVTSYQHATGRVRFAERRWAALSPEIRREVVLHELAHVCADLRHGERCMHGPRWRAVMRELGLTPRRQVSL